MSMLDEMTIRQALAMLGERLPLARDVELLIVGGAAGVPSGELPRSWTTADVDLIHCTLPGDRDLVLAGSADVARELSLPGSWLSEDVGLYAWTLPDNWESRRVLVGTFGRLRVYAAGRLDLIAMKLIAHRERDLEYLARMRVKAEEREFVLRYLDSLAR
jgi:hypothetical protein